jgi:hypothetical protein
VEREIAGLIVLTVTDERISKIHVYVEPATVQFLRAQLPAQA